MSHFAVAVITAERPTQELISQVLQPFHEYECTGIEDQYVVEVDKTDEVEEDWKSVREGGKIILADGTEKSKWDDMFKQEVEETDEFNIRMGRKTRTVYGVLPDGAREADCTVEEQETLQGKTKEEWVKDYHGYDFRDSRFYRKTNPNKQWDWWVIGGRWKGMLRVNDGGAPIELGGRPGVLGSHYSNGFDCCKIADIDLVAMQAVGEEKVRGYYAQGYKEYVERLKDAEPLTWEQWNQKAGEYHQALASIRTEYEAAGTPGAYATFIDDLKEKGDARAILVREPLNINSWSGTDKGTVEEAVAKVVPFSTFAVLMDGKWYERGEMGWWGMVSNEKDADEWQQQFAELIRANLEKFVTIVDFHI